MLNESPNTLSFSVVEAPKRLALAFFVIGELIFGLALTSDLLKFSPSGFDSYEFICVVFGIVFNFVGFSLLYAHKKRIEIPLLPENLFRQFMLILLFCGVGLSVTSGLYLAS